MRTPRRQQGDTARTGSKAKSKKRTKRHKLLPNRSVGTLNKSSEQRPGCYRSKSSGLRLPASHVNRRAEKSKSPKRCGDAQNLFRNWKLITESNEVEHSTVAATSGGNPPLRSSTHLRKQGTRQTLLSAARRSLRLMQRLRGGGRGRGAHHPNRTGYCRCEKWQRAWWWGSQEGRAESCLSCSAGGSSVGCRRNTSNPRGTPPATAGSDPRLLQLS